MIQRLHNHLSRVRRDEGGFGLLELLVAFGIFSILAVVVISGFSGFTATMIKDQIATRNTNVAAVGMNEMTRVIRAATTIPQQNAEDLPAFVFANKEKITLYAFIDTSSGVPAPVKVQFEVKTWKGEPRVLTETRWLAHPKAGAPSYWEFDTVFTERVIARSIVTPTGTQASLFNYQEINPTTLNPVDLALPSGGMAAANLKKIAVVEVTIKVQTDPAARAAAVLITNQVGIPNLGVSRLSLS